jgi:hypothetical protein
MRAGYAIGAGDDGTEALEFFREDGQAMVDALGKCARNEECWSERKEVPSRSIVSLLQRSRTRTERRPSLINGPLFVFLAYTQWPCHVHIILKIRQKGKEKIREDRRRRKAKENTKEK